ncbi:alpha/beta hydrolase fold domain-containing protein [Streptomyces flaveolus]|uniref:alpha/beta hydrolase fold domain-containing protein n=1 Tax=Streptomyces flaveolus TaxID=67297 RepID=UPI0016714376|nr:alpha/beta hydrolase fold domain-containing protein [Streptomyces flaveolus]GGQ52105.1 alpha/beta hydrolase [Streptomyces flaveolus]
MSETATAERPPQPDWSSVTDEGLAAYRVAENHFRASDAARPLLGHPDPGATIGWEQVPLPGRDVPVRVYRPSGTHQTPLSLVLHVHGGGFVGTAVQCDWANSHLAARLPALVVSVEHRLLDRDTSLTEAAADGWDVLEHVVRHAERWRIDPARVAVFGESCGALISALAAIRAREAGLRLVAQVLVNPAVDVTRTMYAHASMSEHGYGTGLSVPQLELFQRLAVPPGADGRSVSPLHAEDLGSLAPALVVVPTHDAVADHGRRYAERLSAAGTTVRITEYPKAVHAFLTLPGVQPQAEPARAEILAFLRAALTK